jgi:hypothetical protein
MTKDDKRRLEELERRVKELEARPQAQPYYYPVPYPYMPAPTYPAYPQYPSPWWTGPVWCAPGFVITSTDIWSNAQTVSTGVAATTGSVSYAESVPYTLTAN